ncbi:hypothetical protein BKA62DRAFT_64971 [Auriculariales sp. MPI-PUGE-AT-0066]|nr:hypothetical protein BKA62DRAFT_64971 [Auriculariales sp. MPI-PUGE-AT-0066]
MFSFVAILLLLSQLSFLAYTTPVPGPAFLVGSTPASMSMPFNSSISQAHKNVRDVAAQLDHLAARARMLHNSTLMARDGGDMLHADGLLDSLSGLPVIGGLLPVVGGLLKTVESLLPLDSIPILGPLLGMLDVDGDSTISATSTQSAGAPIATLDPVASAARLKTAQDLLRAASAELNKAVKIAEALVANNEVGSGVPAPDVTVTTTSAADPSATETASVGAANVQEFSFSGRVGHA